MKKALLFVAFMLCCAMTMFAQNNKISYQAVVRDAQNKLVSNQPVTVTVSIFNGSTTSAAYSETQTATTNINGLISLLVGNGTVTGGNWESIDWKTARVKTTVSLNGATLGTLEMPFTAVPYAMYAEHAAEIDPDAAVVTGIYNKILYDSLALGALIDENTNDIHNLQTADSKLDQRIAADSSRLVTLKNRVNTFNTHICDTMMACQGIKTMRDSIKINANAIANKANTADVYNKTEVYNKNEVYNRNEVFTKTESDARYLQSFTEQDPTIPAWAKAATKPTYNYSEISGTPNLANVATSGSYNDLTDIPTNLVFTNASNNFTGNTNTFSGTVTIPNAIDDLKATTASTKAVNVNDLLAVLDSLTHRMNILHDSLVNIAQSMPTMEQETFILTGTTGEFQLQHAPNASCIYRMYINGVMVGGSNNEVLKLKTGTTNTLEYDATKNGNYTLKADDKVTIVYWY